MEGTKTFWLVNSFYTDIREFHYSSDSCLFVVYFRGDKALFVLDNTCDIISPNNLLIIEALSGENDKNPKTKWDSILKNQYNIDPIKIRPKENTKYKKLDISYSDLSLYEKFALSPTDELLDSILEKREILSLDNAYQRESENLLNHNKSTQTIEKATVTLENLKKKILHLSKRLKRQNELENENPEKADAVLKAELVQKMYDNTEKLKRTERRIKRAQKRSANAFDDLSLNRAQIQEIKNRISQRRENIDVEGDRILSRFNYETPNTIDENYIEKNTENQDVKNRKIEDLTIENLSAKNDSGEKIGTTLSAKETIMAKDTENKNVKTTTEFKPPFVDDTTQDTQKTSGVKFARKTEVLDDKYKKVWMYVASIMVSLIIVFGLFFFLSGDGEEAYVDNSNYVEQNYQEPVKEPVVEEPVEEVEFEEETVIEPKEVPAPVEEVKPAPVSKPVPAPKKTTSVVSPKPVAKAPVKQQSKPVVEKEVVVEDEDLTNIPEEDEEYDESEEVFEDEEDEDSEDSEKVSTLNILKKEYVDNVLAGDAYLKLISYLKDNFFTLEDGNKIDELEKMNHYWNDFRNATYDAYYESDYTLKSDINYEEYANDEYLLRLYTNAYYDFYEYVVNEFVMKYEYANNTATSLYAAMENELDTLGRPIAKLEVLARIYNAIQAQGGVKSVLSSIAEKDEAETAAADNMEIEASLIPLTATTEVVYQENLYSDDDTEIVSKDSTEVVTDFSKEYAESDDIIIPETEEVEEDDDSVTEIADSDEEDTDEIADSEEEDTEDEELANADSEDENEEEIAESEEDEEVATSNPENLEVVVEDDSDEIASIEPTSSEEELIVSSDSEEESDSDEEYYAEEDEETSDDDVEYTDSEEEVVVEEENV